jgi:hypothetical protein
LTLPIVAKQTEVGPKPPIVGSTDIAIPMMPKVGTQNRAYTFKHPIQKSQGSN